MKTWSWKCVSLDGHENKFLLNFQHDFHSGYIRTRSDILTIWTRSFIFTNLELSDHQFSRSPRRRSLSAMKYSNSSTTTNCGFSSGWKTNSAHFVKSTRELRDIRRLEIDTADRWEWVEVPCQRLEWKRKCSASSAWVFSEAGSWLRESEMHAHTECRGHKCCSMWFKMRVAPCCTWWCDDNSWRSLRWLCCNSTAWGTWAYCSNAD